MSLLVAVCGACGRTAFPPPFLCAGCGGGDWRQEQVETGTLEAIADRGEVRIGAVRLPGGPLAIVRLEGEAQIGATVTLSQDLDVPVARA